MAELLLIVAPIIGILSLVLLAAATSPLHVSGEEVIAKWAGGIFLTCVAFIIWTSSAIESHDPAPTVLERPIEELRNVPFYFNENNKPVEITGDGRFADPKTTVVHIKTFPGGWKYGLYVSENRKVEFAKKAEVEK